MNPSFSASGCADKFTTIVFVRFLHRYKERIPLPDRVHNTAKVPFIEKSPASPQLHLERPQLVDRPEPDSFKEAPPRNQLRPEPAFTGNRDDVQRPQIIYIKNSMAHEPNGRPQLPHVEGVRRRYRFDDIPDFRQGQWWNERPQISQEYERDMEHKKSPGEQTASATSVKPILELPPPPTRKPIEVTQPPRRLPNCLYSGHRYEHGTPVKTTEPCLNCTCQAGVLVCYLRVCPAVVSVPEGCTAVREPGQCCATTICNDASNGETSNEVNSVGEDRGREEDNATSIPGDITRDSDSLVGGKRTDFVLDEQAVTLVPDEKTMSRRLDSPIVVTSSPESSSKPVRPGATSGNLIAGATQSPSTTSTTTAKSSAGACLRGGQSYELGSVLPSEVCQTCVCTQKGIICANVECPLAAVGCTGIIPEGHCCPTEYVCDKIRNMKNETEQLKIIPDPRPGSVKETHLFRRIDGDSFESYLTTATAEPEFTVESDQKSRDDARDKNAVPGSPDRSTSAEKQVVIDTEGVNMTSAEAGNLFYAPETLLELSTASGSEFPDGVATSTSHPLAGGRSIDSHGNRSEQQPNLTQTEPPEKPSGFLDSPQNYLQPVYVPEDQVKKIDHAESLLKEKNPAFTTMEELNAPASRDGSEPFAMASTTVSTFAAFPDTDTKLSKYSNNSKKKSTFTVNLGSHITVAHDSAEVTTEDGITTAKNSEFSMLAENEDSFWKRRPTMSPTTTELPRPSPHIFTLQEKQDRMTPTESSLKLTRKQGDDITTIPGLIISTPSSLLRTDESAKAAEPPSSSVPPYIITTSDVINNEDKFHPSQRPTSAETFSTEFGLRKTDVEPTVQSSTPSKSIYRTATSATATITAATPPSATPATPLSTNSFDGRAKKKPQQPEKGSPNEESRKKFDARPSAGNIDLAEGIKMFSTLLLSGLAKTRSDQSTASPTSPTVFYESVTEKFPSPGQYSNPAPVDRNPLNNARSSTTPTAASSPFFISNIPLSYHPSENVSKVSKLQNSKSSPADRYNSGWQTLSNHHAERLGNKSTTPQQSVVSFVANDALFVPHGHPLAANQTISSRGSGCFINGVNIADGELISKEDPCVQCRCHRGEELCTVRKCPAPPREDCVQERLGGTCCPRYTCKLDSARTPTRVPHRRIVDDGFHQPNHPKYVPHIDIMIAAQNPQSGARIVDRPNSKQEYIALEGVRRSPASGKKLSDLDEKLRSVYPAVTEGPQEVRAKSATDSEFTTIPTATLKVLLQHAANNLPTSTDTLSATTGHKPFATTESPIARSLFKVLSETPHPNTVPLSTASASKNSPVLHDFVTENQSQSASSPLWNMLKVSGCNIYGRYYRVNEVVTELTERCKVCTCTAIGVHCIHTC